MTLEPTDLLTSSALPAVVHATSGTSLATVAAEHGAELDNVLAERGAVLFRGFGVDHPQAMADAAEAFCDTLFDKNGEHDHDPVARNVYTPVAYSNTATLMWHNETTFNERWPRKVLFGCGLPAETGGQTPLVDGRKVFAELDPQLRDKFVRHGVAYLRAYGTGVGLHWSKVFRTEDRNEVERRCVADGFEVEWLIGGGLRTRCVRPAAVVHPVTGESCWVTQFQHWHPACLDPETRESMLMMFDEEQLPRNATFGDGTRISVEEVAHVLEVYGRHEVVFDWEQGDLLVVDNLVAAHGRKPFTGPRNLLVSLGDMSGFDDVAAVVAPDQMASQ